MSSLIFTCLLTSVYTVAVDGIKPNQQDYPLNVRIGRCDLNEFDCNPNDSSPTCIPFSVVRDCIIDCENGADEECGHNQTMCDVNIKRTNSMCGKCVENNEVDRFCVDRKWKNLYCPSIDTISFVTFHVRQCQTTQNCVHESWLNDGEMKVRTVCSTYLINSIQVKCVETTTPKTTVKHEHNNQTPKLRPSDCSEILQLKPDANSSKPQKAYDPHCLNADQCPSFWLLCDFELFGGGWTKILHREWPTQIHFNKTWAEYKVGFGSLAIDREFWLGNDRLHSLTAGRQCVNELIIKMKTAREGREVIARYSSFMISDESDLFRLNLGPLVTNPSLTTVDELISSRSQYFVTWDRQVHYCSQTQGGWWMSPGSCNYGLTADMKAQRNHGGVVWNNDRMVSISVYMRPNQFVAPVLNQFAYLKVQP
ncbi:Angiopoietin-related protein 5 [Aphelenchoides besseyi]|nr:Angiopoietin-related protein 5 [Aphelenchoides besseyi]